MSVNEMLFEAIGNVEDRYLEEADKKNHRKPVVLSVIAASCLVFLILVSVFIQKMDRGFRSAGDKLSGMSGYSTVKASVVVTDTTKSMYYSQAEDKTYYYTDYTVKVLESYDNSFVPGQTLVIRDDELDKSVTAKESDPEKGITIGCKLIVFLYKPQTKAVSEADKSIYYISDGGKGAFLVEESNAVCLKDGESFQLDTIMDMMNPPVSAK